MYTYQIEFTIGINGMRNEHNIKTTTIEKALQDLKSLFIKPETLIILKIEKI